MDTTLQTNAVNETVKRNNSDSSYATIESVQIDTNNSDITESTKLSSNRTVLSYSAKNHTLVVTNDTTSGKSLDIHYFTYQNNVAKIKWLLENIKRTDAKHLREIVSQKDKHENTPLHIACMLGNLEICKLLCAAGAVVKTRNRFMWTPLNEAISYGNRELVRCVLKKFEVEVEAIVDDAKPKIVKALTEMDDFYVEIKWDFESWIPFISRFLPSDTCKLYKKGSKLRLDCTLGDISARHQGGPKESAANSVGASISPFRWERGDLSFLFEIDKVGTKNSIVFMNNTKKNYMIIDKQQISATEHDIEKEIDLLLSKEMIFIKLNTKQATFSPTQIGWFNKKDKIEHLNGYLCHFYDINNLFIVTKLRMEHLSDEELKRREEKQLKIKKHLSSGGIMSSSKNEKSSLTTPSNTNDDFHGLDEIEIDDEIEYRPSLQPPPKNTVPWDEYINSPAGNPPCIGRRIKSKEAKKEFKAQVAMSREFPLSISDLDNLLDALVPLAKFRKLKEFINLKMPPGFPVKIDIPIVPAVAAKVCFQNFKKNCEHSADLFRIPNDYHEEVLDFEGISDTKSTGL